jgi:hypothetical protein
MKILTNNQHNQLIKEIENLRKELTESRDLKTVLTELANKTGIPKPTLDSSYLKANSFCGVDWAISSAELILPDNVLVYVDDILGGKVIKQQANKCLVIDKDGNVKTGVTKEKPDKGYNYKLIRE